MRLENLTRPIVSLDVEATGPAPQLDRVTQFGAIKIYPDGREVPWSTLINPGPKFQAPEPAEGEAEWVSIWRKARLAAPFFKDVSRKLYEALKDCDIIGYNVKRFDLRILDVEFSRCGLPSPFIGANILDGFMLWSRLEPRQLEHAATRFGAKQEGPLHDAAADAALTLQLVRQQLEWGTEVPETVEGVHQWLWPKQDHYLDDQGKLQRRGDRIFVTFGKWAGKCIDDIPTSYFEWMLGERDGRILPGKHPDFSHDLLAEVRSILDARRV